MPLSTSPGTNNEVQPITGSIVLSSEERDRLEAEMLSEQESLQKFVDAKSEVREDDDNSLLEDLNNRNT